MSFTQTLEISIILFISYVLIRSTGRHYFSEEHDSKGAGLLIIFLGIIIFIFINTTIGIILVLAGVALILIPQKQDKNFVQANEKK